MVGNARETLFWKDTLEIEEKKFRRKTRLYDTRTKDEIIKKKKRSQMGER